MGWCGGTDIFDSMCSEIFKEGPIDKKGLIVALLNSLWDNDWDCECESNYFNHPLVKETIIELDERWKDNYREME